MNILKHDRRFTQFNTNQINDIINHYKQFHSLKKIADTYKCGQQTIKRILIENNIKVYNYVEYYKIFGLDLESRKEQIFDLYTVQNKSIKEIGKILNVEKGSISSFLRKARIPTHIQNIQFLLQKNKQKVIEVYKKTGTLVNTAKEFNCNSMSIARFLDNENIPYRKYKGHNITPFSDDDLKQINILINDYHKTLYEVGIEYNCSGPRIAAICDKHKIKRPTVQEQVRINGQKSINSLYLRKPYQLPSLKTIYLQGYEPQFLDYVFQNKLLKESDITYKVHRIPYKENDKQRYYFPDFYIPKLNLIVEIKSSWILKKQTAQNQYLKEQATRVAGFNYILILDNDFTEFIKLFNK